ncbi:MAG: hypothetical protein ABIS26_00320 [Candidatus Paceibacterota bacterium]
MTNWQFGFVVFVTLGVTVYMTSRISKSIRSHRARRHRRQTAVAALGAIIAELPSLRRELLEIAELAKSNALTAIVRFFNTTSIWQDRDLATIVRELKDVGDQKNAAAVESLGKLFEQFRMTGRAQYGWNRTEKGQLVTEDDVYLGNIWGIWTFNVSYWREVGKRNDPKGTHGYAEKGNYFSTRNTYDIICDQAREFIDDHTPVMVGLIDELTDRDVRKLRIA